MSATEYRIEIKALSEADGGGYLAWVPDLPGCMSDGETPSEAEQNVRAAIEEWIEEALRLGKAIPAPSRATAHA